MKHFGWIIPFFCILSLYAGAQEHRPYPEEKDEKAFLFVYFTGNKVEDESIHFAVSADGYHYLALNNNRPVIDSKLISSTGGVRDPHIVRAQDGKTFYMVATDMTSNKGWNSNRAMVLMKSTDLIHWQSNVINIQKRFPGNDSLLRVWAPQTIYDLQAGKYMVYWSMKHGNHPDIIYYAYANDAFTDLATEPKQLYFPSSGKSCIDGDIVLKDSVYHLFYKTEGNGNGIRQATTTSLTLGKWNEKEGYMQQTKDPVEGSGIFKFPLTGEYILMYDVYTKGRYQFTKSKTLDSFSVIDNDMSMNFHPRHGTIINITRSELNTLFGQWGRPEGFPEIAHNPVLEGYYADPEVLYSEKNKKYYIYPTSDGFAGWSGTYFKTFSSSDLQNWKDEGVILDLNKDVSWAKRNAWAPCIIEQKIKRKYKYYYYFTAAQKIGVAVADDPAGPFVDAGKPVIDRKPDGIKGGQEIDPDVFSDPVTGKNYLYWGNGYMACAELNKDMLSVNMNSLKIITPDKTFREGTYVFYRKGKYYFMWSEGDTRDEDYRVRYGIASSPVGPITIPADNIVIAKDTAAGIYGTGHNSVVQTPGKDEWHIVYHRFSYPNGIKMGRAAGFNREVCIDALEFNEDGTIKRVKPTL
jgi:arabinoxylan arabinofuranohydrolase